MNPLCQKPHSPDALDKPRGSGLDVSLIVDSLPVSMRSTLQVREQLESTQSALLDDSVQWPDRTVFLSDDQTGGRGRRGRAWQSAPGSSLALSILAREHEGKRWAPSLSLAMGVAAVEAMHTLGAKTVRLKWPNDLIADGRKLGGILLETFRGGIVAGVGINRTMPPELRQRIESACTDLVELGIQATLEDIAVALILAWNQALDVFAMNGLPAFHERWRALDALADQPVTVWVGTHEGINGVARGIDTHGRLQVEVAGQLQIFSAADVSVRMA